LKKSIRRRKNKMLAYAKPYEDQVKELFRASTFDFYYKYGHLYNFREDKKIPDSTWEGHHFVSMQGEEVIGYIAYDIDRPCDLATGLFITHFGTKYPFTFGRDVITAIKEIFEKFHFRKLNTSVVIGNPVEKTYDRLIKRAGGRIVGIREKEVRLIDGLLYDLKLYEILREGYFMVKEHKT
jgi:hypothetical protein